MSDIVTGSVRVHPGLTEEEVREGWSRWHVDIGASDLVLTATDNSTVGILDDGSIGVIGDAYLDITWRWEDDYSASSIREALGELIQLLHRKLGEDMAVEGSFTVWNDEASMMDVRRVRVDGLRVIEERPTLVWPNGDVQELL